MTSPPPPGTGPPEETLTRMFGLADRIALVTGGSRGIGLMAARGLATAGARVVIVARDEHACDQAVAELEPVGDVSAIPADLSTVEGCRAVAAKLSAQGDHLHVLVNNAGATWAAPVDDYPVAGWNKVVDLNLRAPFFLTQAVLPFLERAASPANPARVINIGSIDGMRVPSIGTYAYTASKAGLHHLTQTLAVELGPRGITVNAVAPGPFETKMTSKALESLGTQITDMTPLRRIGQAQDIAGVLVYLASHAGSHVTGAVIPVDGGFRLATTV